MPIDANIAMGGRAPQLESPINQMAAAMQLQGVQQANELNRQKMEEYARAREMEGVRRNALAGIDLSSPDSFNRVAQSLYDVGDLEGAQKMLGARAELEHKRAQTDKERASTGKLEAEGKVEKLKFLRDQLPILAANATDGAIDEMAANMFKNGVFTSFEQANASAQQMKKLPLDQRRQEILKMAVSADKALEQQYLQEDLGNTKRIVAVPKLGGGAPRVVSEQQVTLSPVERARVGLERERLNRDTSSSNVAHVITDNAGNVTMINKKGEVIGPRLTGAGKQSATYEKNVVQEKQLSRDREMVISELEKAVKNGGLIDQSTGSGAGALYDAGARFFGSATAGDIAIGQLKPIADLAVKMVPRFEGPQSNADTASYTAAAGQLADPGLPRDIRKAAGKEVLRILKERKGQFGMADTASGSAAPPAGFVVDN